MEQSARGTRVSCFCDRNVPYHFKFHSKLWTAPSHYLNQCWLIINGDLWHSPETNFKRSLKHYFHIAQGPMSWIRSLHMDQVTKVRLSCYLVLLSTDSKTRQHDSRTFVTWPICPRIWPLTLLPFRPTHHYSNRRWLHWTQNQPQIGPPPTELSAPTPRSPE